MEAIERIELEEALRETAMRVWDYFTLEELHECLTQIYFWPYHTMDTVDDVRGQKGDDENFDTSKEYYRLVESGLTSLSKQEYFPIIREELSPKDLIEWALESPLRHKAIEFLEDASEDLGTYWDLDRVDIEVNHVVYRGLRCKD